MDKQYWVGEFFVDLSRNQITQHGQPQTLPPKALQVLTYLAKNRGRVVSYDELLEQIWSNAVVTPNTLQRSIAQLRKVLGENSKAQNLIKTHAKQGYSLEGDVRFHQNGQSASVSSSEKKASENTKITATVNGSDEHSASSPVYLAKNRVSVGRFFTFSLIVFALAISTVLIGTQQRNNSFEFGQLRYLTATDDKEYGASYSPDGEFILFRRYYEKRCLNDLWAKNVNTLEEIRLTKERGHYGNHSLSEDGKTLVFIKEQACDEPINQSNCFKLLSVDFEAARIEPQEPDELLHCQNSEIARPTWISRQEIVMMQKNDQNWRLIKYSIADEKSSTLYEMEGGTTLFYTYSNERKLLAVVSIKQDGRQYIDTLQLDGEISSSHPIQFPENMPRIVKLAPALIPNSDDFMFGYGGKLYRLSPTGEVSKMSTSLGKNVGIPYFHPKGDRILLITGQYDRDIALLPIALTSERSNMPAEINSEVNPMADDSLSVFARSVEVEDLARAHPFNDTIAFVSQRTASNQVWLANNDALSMVSDFAEQIAIDNLFWNDEGDQLLVHTQTGLRLLVPQGGSTSYDLPYTILAVFHWDSAKQTVIANILHDAKRKFVELDLSTKQYKVINHRRVLWATKEKSGPLIFMDNLERFWKTGVVEDELIAQLADQGWIDKRFVMEKGRVFGINKQHQAWLYEISSDSFSVLTELPTSVNYLTDVKGNQLFTNVIISERQQIIELDILTGD